MGELWWGQISRARTGSVELMRGLYLDQFVRLVEQELVNALINQLIEHELGQVHIHLFESAVKTVQLVLAGRWWHKPGR